MTVTPATPASAPEGRPEPDLSGKQVGDYQLLRRLGRGGMADVYLAEQLSLKRQVALKVLKKSLAGDEAYIRRFEHEAQAAAKLVHANIVQIYDVDCVDGTHFIAQEYVPGQNLKQLLTRLGRGVDAVQGVNIIRQVAAALHKAADQKIIHRDVKPENIMISPTGEVKVADFGLARVVRDGEALNLTQVGITMGTPLYMSPEQVEGRPVDPRSDLYSFGVTSYHMLAGHPPFDGDTALAVAVQHLRNEPKRLEVVRPDLPEGLCRVVHRMLAKKPEDRYQRAVDLLRELKGLKIDGLDQDWTADLPGFDSADLALSAAGRLEATQQLDRVLQSRLRDQPRKWSALSLAGVIAGLVALGFLSGGLLAWAGKPQPLLETEQEAEPRVKKFETVQMQFHNAQIDDTEAAWKAVAQYFPPSESPVNRRFGRLAQRGLANFYLRNNRLGEALHEYEQLNSVESTERDFQLAGKIGIAAVHDRQADDVKGDDAKARAERARHEEVVKDFLPEFLPEADDRELANRVGNMLAVELIRLLDDPRYQIPPGSE